jgi:AcrR family transcriptional regulator
MASTRQRDERTDEPRVSGWDRRRVLLLSEFEGVALELFAASGYPSVTFDDIAAAAGSSSRTLFRYFPTKEEFLLGLPRRGVERLVSELDALDPSATPQVAAWRFVRDRFVTAPLDSDVLNLWRHAATHAPEVVARVRGQRMAAIMDAVARYCERSVGDAVSAVEVHLASGVIAGAELAMIEAWGRPKFDLDGIVDAAERAVGPLDARD